MSCLSTEVVSFDVATLLKECKLILCVCACACVCEKKGNDSSGGGYSLLCTKVIHLFNLPISLKRL